MNKWLLIGLGGITLAGCSQRQEAGETATQAGALAFQYSYTFRLPSKQISAAQERHAKACEQLGSRCRITGMTYNVDSSGDADASLQMALAAPIARGFGHDGVAVIEQAGGVLAGAQISGSDPAQQTSFDQTAIPADAGRGAAEVARIDRQLARTGLSGPERAELTRQRAVAAEQAQAGGTAAASARAAVSTTPVSFTYHAGRGVGAMAELSDAGQTAYASLLTTLSILLMALAILGPPALLLLALVLLWRRFLAPRWARLFPPRARAEPIATQPAPAMPTATVRAPGA